MSTRTLLIWIIIAGFLGFVAVILRPTEDGTAPNSPQSSVKLIGFDPTQVHSLEIITNTFHQSVTSGTTQTDQWSLNWTSNGEAMSWPAQAVKVRSGLRALATTRVRTNQEESSTIQATQSIGQIVLNSQNNTSTHINFVGAASGGFVPVEIQQRDAQGIATSAWRGKIDKGIYDAFIQTGMLPWRSLDMFDEPKSALQSISVSAGAHAVHVQRTDSGWQMISPYQIHANSEACNELVDSFTSFEAETLIDDLLPETTSGIQKPIASIKASTPQGEYSLDIGTQADLNAESVYAMLTTPHHDSLTTMSTDQLASLTAAPEAYLSKRPSPHLASSIQGIRVLNRDSQSRLLAERAIDTWTINGTPTDSLSIDAINRLVQILTSRSAQQVSVITTSSLPEPVGFIQSIDAKNSVQDEFRFAIQSHQSGMQLVIMKTLTADQSAVWIVSSQEASATGAWLTAASARRP